MVAPDCILGFRRLCPSGVYREVLIAPIMAVFINALLLFSMASLGINLKVNLTKSFYTVNYYFTSMDNFLFANC